MRLRENSKCIRNSLRNLLSKLWNKGKNAIGKSNLTFFVVNLLNKKSIEIENYLIFNKKLGRIFVRPFHDCINTSMYWAVRRIVCFGKTHCKLNSQNMIGKYRLLKDSNSWNTISISDLLHSTRPALLLERDRKKFNLTDSYEMSFWSKIKMSKYFHQ